MARLTVLSIFAGAMGVGAAPKRCYECGTGARPLSTINQVALYSTHSGETRVVLSYAHVLRHPRVISYDFPTSLQILFVSEPAGLWR